MQCPYCKEDIQEGAIKCKHCGSSLLSPDVTHSPVGSKSKVTAGLLALFLGGLGIHKFYLGAWGWGIIYIVCVLTYIPAIMALIEGIRYLTLSEEEFKQKAAALNGPFAFLW